MYKLKIIEDSSSLKYISDTKHESLLINFITDYHKSSIYELTQAIQKIKNNELEKCGVNMVLNSFILNKKGIMIKCWGNGEDIDDLVDNYSIEELEEALNMYCEDYKKVYGRDLKKPDKYTDEIIGGIISSEINSETTGKHK